MPARNGLPCEMRLPDFFAIPANSVVFGKKCGFAQNRQKHEKNAKSYVNYPYWSKIEA